ncbi:MAG: tRNA (cytidine(34)-2'-O)-methyltransferase [Bdellovibrionales bacterium]|nr:tRNA (cytidine(34)-2'-O)-methyltransferase [Bdellovibrionales bacterium]
MATLEPVLNIVLFEPEIPQNTGSIGRLCLATRCALHLIKPLGFSIDAQALKRAGLDYWEHLEVVIHESAEDFLRYLPANSKAALVETRAGKTIYDIEYSTGIFLVFGKETTGLPDWFLNRFASDWIRIPMWDARVRSLNLSNAVSIVAYEAIRQIKKLS